MHYENTENGIYNITDRVDIVDDILQRHNCFFSVISTINFTNQTAKSSIILHFEAQSIILSIKEINLNDNKANSAEITHQELLEIAQKHDTVEKMINAYSSRYDRVIIKIKDILEKIYRRKFPLIIEYYIRSITKDNTTISSKYIDKIDEIFNIAYYSGLNEYLKMISINFLKKMESDYATYNDHIVEIREFEAVKNEIVNPFKVSYCSDNRVPFKALSVKTESGVYYILNTDEFNTLVINEASKKLRSNRQHLVTLVNLNDVYNKNFSEQERLLAKFQASIYFPALAKRVSNERNQPIETLSVADLKNTEEYEEYFDQYASKKVSEFKINASIEDLCSYINIEQLIMDNFDTFLKKTDLVADRAKSGNYYMRKN